MSSRIEIEVDSKPAGIEIKRLAFQPKAQLIAIIEIEIDLASYHLVNKKSNLKHQYIIQLKSANRKRILLEIWKIPLINADSATAQFYYTCILLFVLRFNKIFHFLKQIIDGSYKIDIKLFFF